MYVYFPEKAQFLYLMMNILIRAHERLWLRGSNELETIYVRGWRATKTSGKFTDEAENTKVKKRKKLHRREKLTISWFFLPPRWKFDQTSKTTTIPPSNINFVKKTRQRPWLQNDCSSLKIRFILVACASKKRHTIHITSQKMRKNQFLSALFFPARNIQLIQINQIAKKLKITQFWACWNSN